MKSKELLEIIKKRRSVREFKDKEVSPKTIREALEAARWAPSGLNNQPWRFMVLSQKPKDSLAEYTKYSRVIKKANKLILVFLDKNNSYNYQKDLMAIGASIQNILLYLQAQGLGACWLGQILNKAEAVESELNLGDNLEFVAAVAVGSPEKIPPPREREPLDNFLIR